MCVCTHVYVVVLSLCVCERDKSVKEERRERVFLYNHVKHTSLGFKLMTIIKLTVYFLLQNYIVKTWIKRINPHCLNSSH